jgi:hypothetical protein
LYAKRGWIQLTQGAQIVQGRGRSAPVVKRLGYRLDFRWYNPDDNWPESWRIYNGLAFDGGR